MQQFLTHEDYKTMIVAPLNLNKEIMGYFFLKKTKSTPHTERIGKSKERSLSMYSGVTDLYDYVDRFKKIAKKYNLNYRFMPSKNLGLEESEFLSTGGLEKISFGIIGLLFLASALFLSSNLTGFSVANLTQKTLNMTGALLFIIGIIGLFYYFRRRSK